MIQKSKIKLVGMSQKNLNEEQMRNLLIVFKNAWTKNYLTCCFKHNYNKFFVSQILESGKKSKRLFCQVRCQISQAVYEEKNLAWSTPMDVKRNFILEHFHFAQSDTV